jgi:hypothetical protein
MRKILSFVILSCFWAGLACSPINTPKGQDIEGHCTQAFLDSYNQAKGSSYQVQQSSTDTSTSPEDSVKQGCIKAFNTYGAKSEACLATDLKTGEGKYLSTADLSETCSEKLKSETFVKPSK